MSGEELHGRAERLIAADRVEGISQSERVWLARHLELCPRCRALERATSAALAALESVAIRVPADLARRTEHRVRLAAEGRSSTLARQRILWIACLASWCFGIATAPLVWQGLAALGERWALTPPFTELAFGLWWALPAVVAGAIVVAENARLASTRELADRQQ